jgi:hypothetical protein
MGLAKDEVCTPGIGGPDGGLRGGTGGLTGTGFPGRLPPKFILSPLPRFLIYWGFGTEKTVGKRMNENSDWRCILRSTQANELVPS